MTPTIARDGWIHGPDGKKAYGVRPDGEAYVCLQPRCGAEFPDIESLEQHTCANYREGPELTVHEAPEEWADLDITPAAAERAIELDVDPSEVEGTGEEGRILKSDIEDAADDEED